MLRAEREGSIAIWTIDRPAAKNAIDTKILEGLAHHADEAAKDREIRAIVLTGAGDSFSSGGDLQELRDANSAADAEKLCDLGTRLCKRLGDLDVPVIAAIPGVAYGGGAELALACDLRIADEKAKISFKQVRMGVTTAWGSIPRLISIVGHSSAARLLYTAHEMTAMECRALGLVDYVADHGTSVTLALAWAHDITLGAPNAVAQMKALLRAARSAPLSLMGEERKRFVATWTGKEHADAMEAYFSRRPAHWPAS
jgi:enoyl-CoA hydratase/carnithine racemase